MDLRLHEMDSRLCEIDYAAIFKIPLLFRFGHTMIPPGIYRRDRQCDFKKARNGGPATRLCSVWWDAQVSPNERSQKLRELEITQPFRA